MTSALPGATFRDPAGSLSFEDNQVIRRIDPSMRVEVLELLESPFCRALQKRGDLIEAEVEDSTPHPLPSPSKDSYPDLSMGMDSSQWLDAADLTLNLCEQALRRWLDSEGRHAAQRSFHRHAANLRRHPLL